eukprot:TRINITY_DN13192_c0_g1_i1.p1 TRINITY_DN13192_c0_g1~~TRINITY_DN13192_c0_g1_i1.p1  ORF type:complete len:629 (+),score=138.21 TRINITY_DN13192_c0_g1_i1:70-1956(+)
MGGSAALAKDLSTLLLYWAAAYFSEVLASATKLSSLVFYLTFGCVCGNLGLVGKSHAIGFVAEIGITMVFFALGFEESVGNFLAGIKKAWGIASIGALVPFGCGLGSALLFFKEDGMMAALMCGLAVTATAVSLTMITLKSQGLALSKAAVGIMASAVLDDVGCLALVAIMVPIATGAAEPSPLGISWVVGKSLTFFCIIVVLNVAVFPSERCGIPILKHLPSVGLNHFVRQNHGEQAVIVTLLIGFSVGLLAISFGFHPTIGAYMAGLILKEHYYDLLVTRDSSGNEHHANIYEHVKENIESVAFCWLGPVFFLHLGAQIIIDPVVIAKVIGPAIAIYFILLVGQFLSASLAARYVPGGYTWADSFMIGFGMLGRAELFFVVLNLCYLENSIISEEMFFALTIAAMLLNITVPVAISVYKPYYVKASSGSAVHIPKDVLDGELKRTDSTMMFDWMKSKLMKQEMRTARSVYHPPNQIDNLLAKKAAVEAGVDVSPRGRKSQTDFIREVSGGSHMVSRDGADSKTLADYDLDAASLGLVRMVSPEAEQTINELAKELGMPPEFAPRASVHSRDPTPFMFGNIADGTPGGGLTDLRDLIKQAVKETIAEQTSDKLRKEATDTGFAIITI